MSIQPTHPGFQSEIPPLDITNVETIVLTEELGEEDWPNVYDQIYIFAVMEDFPALRIICHMEQTTYALRLGIARYFGLKAVDIYYKGKLLCNSVRYACTVRKEGLVSGATIDAVRVERERSPAVYPKSPTGPTLPRFPAMF